MASTRLLPLAVACILPLSAVACGGSDDDGPVVPEGTHYGYVVSQASVPENNTQARDFGLDLGAARSGTPDGIVDNQLGVVLGTLSGMGFEIQGTIDEAIAQGSIILLVDFQATDFMNTSAAGLGVKIGATAMPAPCTDPTDLTTCGQHLKGTGSFTIAASSPADALVAGPVVNGTFNGGPGNLALQIALGTTDPLTLNLLAARARATGISDTGITTLTVGGALTTEELNTQVLPAIQVQVAGLIERDCGTGGTPPSCGCAADSTAALILGLFDGTAAGTVQDCTVSVEEIAGNFLIKGLLAPDVCSKDTCEAPDALSLGIQVQTVKGTF
jgi:hypothetical protein